MKLEGTILESVYLLFGILGIAILYGIVIGIILVIKYYYQNNEERLLLNN